jgi:hypothetical protein
MPNDCIALPHAYNPHNHRQYGGSVQRGLSAAIAAAAGFNVCAAADKRYSFGGTMGAPLELIPVGLLQTELAIVCGGLASVEAP